MIKEVDRGAALDTSHLGEDPLYTETIYPRLVSIKWICHNPYKTAKLHKCKYFFSCFVDIMTCVDQELRPRSTLQGLPALLD